MAIETHDCHEFIRSAHNANQDASTEELAAYLFASVVPTSALLSQAISNVVDFYLGDDKSVERAQIAQLASALDVEGSNKQILTYVYEALREFSGHGLRNVVDSQ